MTYRIIAYASSLSLFKTSLGYFLHDLSDCFSDKMVLFAQVQGGVADNSL